MKYFSLLYGGSVHRSSATKKVIPAAEFSTLVSAHEVLEKAQQEAAALLEKTKEACEILKKDAVTEGFQEGLITLNEHILRFDEHVKEIRLQAMQQVIPIALKAAKKIVGSSYEINPEMVVDVVLNSLRSVMHAAQLKLIVNKQDKELLEQSKPKLKEKMERLESFTIEERDDITPGGCIIETESGIINATIENQWRALEAAFEKFALLS